MEEHLVATVTAVIIITIINNIIISKVTDLKKEWKGRVRVRMERTESVDHALSVLHPSHCVVLEQMKREVRNSGTYDWMMMMNKSYIEIRRIL